MTIHSNRRQKSARSNSILLRLRQVHEQAALDIAEPVSETTERLQKECSSPWGKRTALC